MITNKIEKLESVGWWYSCLKEVRNAFVDNEPVSDMASLSSCLDSYLMVGVIH